MQLSHRAHRNGVGARMRDELRGYRIDLDGGALILRRALYVDGDGLLKEKDTKTNQFNIAALGSLSYPRSAPGQEEAVFLANANAVLTTKK